VLTIDEQKQLEALLNKERATEVVEVASVEVLHAGNTTATLAPKQAVEGTPSPATKIPRTAGITVFGQHYDSSGLTREWAPKRK
jgi:hypothetical protein